MGLDIRPDDIEYGEQDYDKYHARWGYSGFNRFRTMLAHCIGCEWEVMVGTGIDKKPDTNSDEYKSMWAHATAHGIGPLLDHSDCDGELTAEECAKVHPALRAIIDQWPPDDFYTIQANKLIAAMIHAVSVGGKLIFG